MTQEEFYLKAMIAMAGNPNYVEVKPAEDDPTVELHTLRIDEIQMDAERLLKEAKDNWAEAFDSASDNEQLKNLAKSLAGIDEGGIKAYVENIEV